jgi:hypothetical protein
MTRTTTRLLPKLVSLAALLTVAQAAHAKEQCSFNDPQGKVKLTNDDCCWDVVEVPKGALLFRGLTKDWDPTKHVAPVYLGTKKLAEIYAFGEAQVRGPGKAVHRFKTTKDLTMIDMASPRYLNLFGKAGLFGDVLKDAKKFNYAYFVPKTQFDTLVSAFNPQHAEGNTLTEKQAMYSVMHDHELEPHRVSIAVGVDDPSAVVAIRQSGTADDVKVVSSLCAVLEAMGIDGLFNSEMPNGLFLKFPAEAVFCKASDVAYDAKVDTGAYAQGNAVRIIPKGVMSWTDNGKPAKGKMPYKVMKVQSCGG